MYNPLRFQETNKKEAFDLMYRYPFATIITQTENGPFVSHLPLTPIWNGEDIELVGHLAVANPHSKLIANSAVTVVFNGPHTYISPTWYVEHDVPTWNYVVAHATGHTELYQNAESIIKCLKTLTTHVESLWPSGWVFSIPEDLQGTVLEKSIVGFKIKVASLNFKKKLSQNRSKADQLGVLEGLKSRADEQSELILNEMKALYLAKEKNNEN